MMRVLIAVLFLGLSFVTSGARAADELVVRKTAIQDVKPVYATVQSLNVVPARARIGGTVADIAVKIGDRVERGQSIAKVGDDKIAIQIRSVDSTIAGYTAQVIEARAALDRYKLIVPKGAAPKTSLEKAQRDYDLALSMQKAAQSQRDVFYKQISEGEVLSPVSGRVLKLPVTPGAVVMPGEDIATIAEENYILRLDVPERLRGSIAVGNTIDVVLNGQGAAAHEKATITVVYPEIENGRVKADARIGNLGDYYVGNRIEVHIPDGQHDGIIIPEAYITTKFGLSQVHLRLPSGAVTTIPVQDGPRTAAGVEILSGLRDGDVLVMP